MRPKKNQKNLQAHYSFIPLSVLAEVMVTFPDFTSENEVPKMPRQFWVRLCLTVFETLLTPGRGYRRSVVRLKKTPKSWQD